MVTGDLAWALRALLQHAKERSLWRSSDAPPNVSFRGLNKRFPEIRFVLGHETKVFTPGKGLF